MTNWDKYFGTPEKASKMVVTFADFQPWLTQVSYMPDERKPSEWCLFFDGRDKYAEWLNEEADHD